MYILLIWVYRLKVVVTGTRINKNTQGTQYRAHKIVMKAPSGVMEKKSQALKKVELERLDF